MPDTVKFYEAIGYTVREFKELTSYDAFWQQLIDEYMVARLGRAGDIVRFIVLNEVGGLYMDNDVSLSSWADDWLYITDGILFRDYITGALAKTIHLPEVMMANQWALFKPHHTILEDYLSTYRSEALEDEEHAVLQQQRCFKDLSVATYFDSGPMKVATLLARLVKRGEHIDDFVVLENFGKTNGAVVRIGGEEKQLGIRVSVSQQSGGSTWSVNQFE